MTRWEYHKNQGLPGKGNFPEEEEGADEEGDEGAGEDAAAKMVVPSGGLPMLHKVRAHGERGGQAEGVRAKLRLHRRAGGAERSARKTEGAGGTGAAGGAGSTGAPQARGKVVIARESSPLLRTAVAFGHRPHAPVRVGARGVGVRGLPARLTSRVALHGARGTGMGGDVMVSSAASRRVGAATYRDDAVPVPSALGTVPLDELPRDLPHLARRVEGLLDPLSQRVQEVKARQSSLGSAQEKVRQLSSALDTWRRHVAQGKPAGQRPDAVTGAALGSLGPEGAKYLDQLMLQHPQSGASHARSRSAMRADAQTRAGSAAAGVGGRTRDRGLLDGALGNAHLAVKHAERGLRHAWRAFDSVLRLD